MMMMMINSVYSVMLHVWYDIFGNLLHFDIPYYDDVLSINESSELPQASMMMSHPLLLGIVTSFLWLVTHK